MNAHDFAEMTHHVYGKPSRWWRYSDTFAVASLRDRAGRRLMLPAVKTGNVCYWQRPPEPLPLYAAAAIAARPDAPVLVVEGEPAAEAAGLLFPDHACTTWPGGRQSVGWAGLGPLTGRTVILWPRHDGPGVTAMMRLQERLKGQDRTCRVVRIEVPAGWPPAWDMAQPLPPGVTIDTLRAMLRAAITTLPEPPPGAAAHPDTTHLVLPPEGEGAPKGRKEDVRSDAVHQTNIDSIATSPFRRCAPPSPSGGRDTMPETAQQPTENSEWKEHEVPQAVVCPPSSLPQPKHSSTESVQAASDRAPLPLAAAEPAEGEGPNHLVSAPKMDARPETDPSEGALPNRSVPRRGSKDTWPDLDLSPSDAGRGDLPAFPVEVLPPFWRSWAERAARGASAPVDHVALSLVTVAASLIGARRSVVPAPSWSEPCILWTALVGPPSSGKTPAIKTSLRLLREVEGGLVAAHADALRRHARDVTQARARWNDEALRTTRRGWVPRPRPDDAAPPSRPRRLAAGRPGIEWVAEALEQARGGVLLSRDDRAPWLAGMARDARRTGDDCFWLSAWSGIACTVERRGKPAANLACAAVSILGTIRPDTIASALSDGDDGLTARFLFAWPRRAAFHPLPTTAQPETFEARDALARLRDMPESPRNLPLTPDALASFDRFRRAHHADAGRLEGRAADWWGKGTGTVLRLAGVLALLDWAAQAQDTPEPTHVSALATRGAVDLWRDYLWPHAQAVLRIAGSERQHRARKVLQWIKRQGKAQVSHTELRVEALGRTCNAATTARVAEVLVAEGWLRPVDTTRRARGRPPLRWDVNPHLREARDA